MKLILFTSFVVTFFALPSFADCPVYDFYCGSEYSYKVGNCFSWRTLSCSNYCGNPLSPGTCKKKFEKEKRRILNCNPHSREDGCSIPVQLKKEPISKYYKKLFKEACNQHDVSYATPDTTKEFADVQFLMNMNTVCKIKENQNIVKKGACFNFASYFYLAVVAKGKESYDNGQRWAKDNCN